jgi:GT2 family glycosyltransferase
MYGQGLDWCVRAKNAGWSVAYHPRAEIVHYKGKSAESNKRRATLEFYRAMYLFHRKHFAATYHLATNALVYTGICLRAVCALPSLLLPDSIRRRGNVNTNPRE